jgi:peptidoglycan hydrolase-like protein with peptidoglycan-binding domain
MRNALRRLAFGVLGTGMVVAAAAGATAGIASAATVAPHYGTHHCKPDLGKPGIALVWPTVKQGAKGERVYAIQYLLNQSGYRIKIDGQYGSETTKAVRSFQEVTHVVPADGIVGTKTWEALILTVKQGVYHSDAVRAVQHYLRYRYGATTLKVDGDFGPATTAAVKDFQAGPYGKKAHLTVDGIVGTSTWHTLVVNKN